MSANVVVARFTEALNSHPEMRTTVQHQDGYGALVTAFFQEKEFAHVKIDAKGSATDILGKAQVLSDPKNITITVDALGTGANITLPSREYAIFIWALISTGANWTLSSVPSLPSSSPGQRILGYRADIERLT